MKFRDVFTHITSFFCLLFFFKLKSGSSFTPPYSTDYYIFDLYGTTDDDFSSLAELWMVDGLQTTATSKFYQCGTSRVLGGPGVLLAGGYMERTYFGLPDHDLIFFSIEFIMIDNWQGTSDSFWIDIDGKTISTLTLSSAQATHGTPMCQTAADKELESTIVGRAYHSNEDLTIRVSFAFFNEATTSLGIKNIVISLVNNTAGYNETTLVLLGDSTIPLSTTCAANQYQDFSSPTNCSSCAPECESCFGPTNRECYRCKPEYSFIDNQCKKCGANCLLCEGTANNECTICKPNFILNWNNTCIPTSPGCLSPDVLEGTGDVKMCNTLCMPDNFMLPDKNCVGSCDSPLIQRFNGRAKFCDVPCNPLPTQYIYWNGSCLNTCPHIETGLVSLKLCKSCDQNYYLYLDKTCQLTCPPSFFQKNESNALFCDYPCVNTTKFLFPNKSCLTECAPPFQQRIEGDYKFCDLPCENPSYFFDIEDEMCMSSCGYPYKIEDQVLCKIDMTQAEIDHAKLLAVISNNVNKVITITGIIATFFGYHDPGPLCLVALVRMVSKIKFMEINFPGKLQKMLIGYAANPHPFTIFPGILEKLKEGNSKYTLPENFDQFKLHSSFLVNYWPYLFILIAFGISVPFIYLVKALTKKYPSCQKFVEKVRQSLKWNLLIMYFIADYGSIVLFTSFELQKPLPNSMMTIFSYLVCLLVNGITGIIVVRSLEILTRLKNALKHYSKIRRHRVIAEFKNKWGDYQIIYDCFKNDSFLKQAFIPLYILRIFLFDAIIGYMYLRPLAQAICITLLSVAVILYMAIRSPFRRRKKQIQHLIQETIFLIINVCILALAGYDAQDSKAVSSRDILGDIIIYVKMIFFFAAALFLIVQAVYYMYQAYKNRNKTILQIEKEIEKQEEAEQDPGDATANESNNNIPAAKKQSFIINQSSINLLQSGNTSFNFESNFLNNTKNIGKEDDDWKSPEKPKEQYVTLETRKLSNILGQIDGSPDTSINNEIRLRNGIIHNNPSVDPQLNNMDYQRWLKGGPSGLGMNSGEIMNYKSKFLTREDNDVQIKKRRVSTVKRESNLMTLPNKSQLGGKLFR